MTDKQSSLVIGQERAKTLPNDSLLDDETKGKIFRILSTVESQIAILNVVSTGQLQEPDNTEGEFVFKNVDNRPQEEAYLVTIRKILIGAQEIDFSDIEAFVAQLREIIEVSFVQQDADKIRGLLDGKILLLSSIPPQILLIIASTCINTQILSLVSPAMIQPASTSDRLLFIKNYVTKITKNESIFTDDHGKAREINDPLIYLFTLCVALNMEAQYINILAALQNGLDPRVVNFEEVDSQNKDDLGYRNLSAINFLLDKLQSFFRKMYSEQSPSNYSIFIGLVKPLAAMLSEIKITTNEGPLVELNIIFNKIFSNLSSDQQLLPPGNSSYQQPLPTGKSSDQ